MMDDAFYRIELLFKVDELSQKTLGRASSSRHRKTFEPIFKSLEALQLRAALKACTKALEKAPKDVQPLLKCCKAMSLVGLDRTPEVAPIVNGLIKTGAYLESPDVFALIAWIIPTADLNDFLDKAVQNHSDSILQELYKVLIYHQDHKRLQQIGLKLHKEHPSMPSHLHRALTAMLLGVDQQLKAGQPPNVVLLDLADRYAPPEPTDLSEYWIKVKTLELRIRCNPNDPQAKTNLLTLLYSPNSFQWTDRELGFELWRRQCILDYGGTADWQKLYDDMVQLLEDGDSNWHTIRTAVTALELSSKQGTDLDAGKIGGLLQRLADDAEKGKERGYALGRVYLRSRAQAIGFKCEGDASLLDLIKVYFDRFGSKSCCFDDLLAYIKELSTEDATNFVGWLEATETDPTGSKAITVGSLRSFLIYQREYTLDTLRMLAKGFLDAYFAALPLGKDLKETDLQPADGFALLAAEAFIRAWKLTGNVEELVQASVILQFALDKSFYCYQIRFTLGRVYRLLGLATLAFDVLTEINVRSIQHDSLSHFISERASTFLYQHGDALELFENVLPSQYQNEYETLALCNSVSIRGVLFKFEEYAELLHAIRFSFARAAHSIERTKIGFQSLESNVQVDASIFTRDLVDKRDLTVLSDSLVELTEMGPRVSAEWVRVQAALAIMAVKPELADTLADAFSKLNFAQGDLTEAEQASAELLYRNWRRVRSPQHNQVFDDVTAFFESCIDHLQKTGARPFTWDFSHWLAVTMETLAHLYAQKAQLAEDKSKNAAKALKTFSAALTTSKSALTKVLSVAPVVEPTQPIGNLIHGYEALDYVKRKENLESLQASARTAAYSHAAQILKKMGTQ